MQDSLIPLFPLEVVLFPGQPLPLHIFEERYKVMIRECLATEGPREFGVVLARPNDIVKVGCTAEVVELVRSYADGRYGYRHHRQAPFRAAIRRPEQGVLARRAPVFPG